MMTTTAQAAAYEVAGDTEGSVVLAVNGDYYNMSNGCPLGSVICEGNTDLHPDNQEPYFAVLKDGSFVIVMQMFRKQMYRKQFADHSV